MTDTWALSALGILLAIACARLMGAAFDEMEKPELMRDMGLVHRASTAGVACMLAAGALVLVVNWGA